MTVRELKAMSAQEAAKWISEQPEQHRLLWLRIYNEALPSAEHLKWRAVFTGRRAIKDLSECAHELEGSAYKLAEYLRGDGPWNSERYATRYAEAVPRWHHEHSSFPAEIRDFFFKKYWHYTAF